MYILVFRRYAPFDTFGLGFEGDNFDGKRDGPIASLNEEEATGRTTGIIVFDRKSVGNPTAYSSGSRYTGFGTGFRDLVGKHLATVSSQISSRKIFENKVSFTASTAGSNPFFNQEATTAPDVGGYRNPHSSHSSGVNHIAPDIDTYIDFKAEWLTTKANHIKFSGAIRGDTFPDLEVFILDTNNEGIILFDGRTTGGRNTGPFTRLAGSNEEKELGEFSQVVEVSADKGTFIGSYSCQQTTMEIFPSAPTSPTSQLDIRRGVYGVQRFRLV